MTPRYLLRYRQQNPPPPDKNQVRLAEYLRRMPPLKHYPDPDQEFKIGDSQVIRYIIFAMGGDPDRRSDWSRASRIFHEARTNRKIFFNRKQRTWQGPGFAPGPQPPFVRQWMKAIKRQTSGKAKKRGGPRKAGTPPRKTSP